MALLSVWHLWHLPCYIYLCPLALWHLAQKPPYSFPSSCRTATHFAILPCGLFILFLDGDMTPATPSFPLVPWHEKTPVYSPCGQTTPNSAGGRKKASILGKDFDLPMTDLAWNRQTDRDRTRTWETELKKTELEKTRQIHSIHHPTINIP